MTQTTVDLIDYSKDSSHQIKMIKKINSPEFKKMIKQNA